MKIYQDITRDQYENRPFSGQASDAYRLYAYGIRALRGAGLDVYTVKDLNSSLWIQRDNGATEERLMIKTEELFCDALSYQAVAVALVEKFLSIKDTYAIAIFDISREATIDYERSFNITYHSDEEYTGYATNPILPSIPVYNFRAKIRYDLIEKEG